MDIVVLGALVMEVYTLAHWVSGFSCLLFVVGAVLILRAVRGRLSELLGDLHTPLTGRITEEEVKEGLIIALYIFGWYIAVNIGILQVVGGLALVAFLCRNLRQRLDDHKYLKRLLTPWERQKLERLVAWFDRLVRGTN